MPTPPDVIPAMSVRGQLTARCAHALTADHAQACLSDWLARDADPAVDPLPFDVAIRTSTISWRCGVACGSRPLCTSAGNTGCAIAT